MTLNMSYAEFSLLRQLVKAKQMELWKTRWLPGLKGKESMTPAQIKEAFDEKMNREVPDWDVICTDEDCCSMLLRRFNDMELDLHVGEVDAVVISSEHL